MVYEKRLVDEQLDAMLSVLPAIALEGAKAVGKTATATRRAHDVYALDDAIVRSLVEGDPRLVLRGKAPTFIDEWQLVAPTWDVVRRAVDAGATPGRFLLAGSAMPWPGARTHSGAGRIVRLMMRPMALPERGVTTPAVSLATLLEGGRPDVEGDCALTLRDYVEEIVASGFPGIRAADPAARAYLLASYIDRIVDHDLSEAGVFVRRPTVLRAWLRAYAAATATTASYPSLVDAATPGETDRPSRPTALAYRDALMRMWVLDPLPAWVPGLVGLKRLAQGPKHHLVDPALAARVVGANSASLLRGVSPDQGAGGTALAGALFESLAVQTVRVLSQALSAEVFHARTQGGEHEVDLIVQREDLRVIAMEVKLSSIVRPGDVAHLNWLEAKMPGVVVDKVLLNTGPRAFRRPDGVAVVPLGLLGP